MFKHPLQNEFSTGTIQHYYVGLCWPDDAPPVLLWGAPGGIARVPAHGVLVGFPERCRNIPEDEWYALLSNKAAFPK